MEKSIRLSEVLYQKLFGILECYVELLLSTAARDVRRQGCLFGIDGMVAQAMDAIDLIDELRALWEELHASA